MAEQNLGPRDFFAKEDAIADLGLIACPGAEELCKLVDGHLVRWAQEVGMNVDTFIIRPTARVSSPATPRASSDLDPRATTCSCSSTRATTALPTSSSGMRTTSLPTTISRTCCA